MMPSPTEWAGAHWIKAEESAQGNGCVELAQVGDVIGIRDSKRPGGPVLEFTRHEIDTFVGAAQAGEFNHLRH
jgi:hypothetical protein